MSPRRISVFFYGLFMDAEALRAKGINPTSPRRGRVEGYSLRIGQRATLIPDAKACVYGVLMDLSHQEIEQLYAEPSVRVYRPEAVLAELDNASRVAALCFNLPEAPGLDERNDVYAQRLRDLASRLDLPATYVKGIG